MMFMCNKTYTGGSGVRLLPPPYEFLTSKLFVVFFFLIPSCPPSSFLFSFLLSSLFLSSEDWRLDNVALYLAPTWGAALVFCWGRSTFFYQRLAMTPACCDCGRGFKAGLAGSFSSPRASQEMDPPHSFTNRALPVEFHSGYSFPPWNPCSVRHAGKESHQLMVILRGKQLDMLKSIVLIGQSMHSYPSIWLWIANSLP